MGFDSILKRIEVLETQMKQDMPEVWPPLPPEDGGSSITWMLYKQLMDDGVPIPERPHGKTNLIWVMELGCSRTFEDEFCDESASSKSL